MIRRVRIGPAFLEIISQAKVSNVDLIVQTTHGHGGLHHFLIGSVAEKVGRKSPCPVLTVRDSGSVRPEPTKILAATDFGEHAECALLYAAEFATRFDAELHILHVVPDPAVAHPEIGLSMMPFAQFKDEITSAGRQQLAEIDLKAYPKLRVRRELRFGSAASGIIDYAGEHEMDLIVLGTHGRNPISQMLMGGSAEKVVRHAPCSVLAVHHPEHEFISPLMSVEEQLEALNEDVSLEMA